MPPLHRQAAVITGASRGIGRAIALGLAKAGFNVVVAAKSTESTEKLPGSIYTVAAEVEALGGEALPVRVDVRDADQIEAMAAQALERFGRIDLLVNNAGALHWAGVADTPPKRFDLVMGVNARAAFLCCRAVLPAMIRQGGGHIVNMSPPLDLSILPGPGRLRHQQAGDDAADARPGGGGAAAQRRRQLALAGHDHRDARPASTTGSARRRMWRKPDILVDCVRAAGPARTRAS